jgi:hypothetical protein
MEEEVKRRGRQPGQTKEYAYVRVNDSLRICVESDCLTIESKKVNKETNTEQWITEGYYTSWKTVLDKLIKIFTEDKVNKKKEVELKDLKQIFIDSTNELKGLLLGDFNRAFKNINDETRSALKKFINV